MTPREDARWIVGASDPTRLARLTCRAAARGLATEDSGEEDGAPFRLTATVLDLENGTLRAGSFYAEEGGRCRRTSSWWRTPTGGLVEDAERRYGDGASLPPSAEWSPRRWRGWARRRGRVAAGCGGATPARLRQPRLRRFRARGARVVTAARGRLRPGAYRWPPWRRASAGRAGTARGASGGG